MPEMLNRTLSRGLEILELLSEHPDGLELNQISRAMQIPKSSAFNLLQTLLQYKYIRKLDATQRYQLGLKLFEVGSAAVNHVDISAVIRQYMTDISRVCNETMHCGILSGRDVLYIDKMESTQSIRMSSHVGIRMPLHSTAMGKAFLASLPPEEVARMYEGATLQALTPYTVTDMNLLLGQLAVVRGCGYAIETQECNLNVSCIGVAIRGRDDKPAYALSISAPSFRMGEAEIAAYAQLLLRAQRKIQRVLRAV
jgi:DNA-binding IclR family transcriptional regulator